MSFRFRGSGNNKKSSSSTSNKVDLAAVEALYNNFKDEDDPDTLDMEGIGKIGDQLGIDPSSDVRLLVLLWKLQAKSKPGCITKEEFIKGMSELGVSSTEQLIQLLPTLDPGFLEKSEFRDFYKFVFQFSREGTNKTIEKDVIIALLPIVLDIHRTPHLEYFLKFLEVGATGHPRITLDQWDSFLQFNHQVELDVNNYEDDGAWPLLLDEYVEWRKAQK